MRTDAARARQKVVGALQAYMVGPIENQSQEIIPAGDRDSKGRSWIKQSPSDVYHTGILYPSQTELDPEEAEHEESDLPDGSGVGDGILSLANAIEQSAMGLTFRCDPKCKSVSISLAWAEYSLVERASEKEEWREYDKEAKFPSNLAWKRAYHQKTFDIDISLLTFQTSGERVYSDLGVTLHAKARKTSDAVSLTFALVNERISEGGGGRFRDLKLYQSSIVAGVSEANRFKKISSPPNHDDDEAWNYELLFFDEQEFAIGHGVSATWTLEEDRSCREVRTDWIPISEVFKASADIESLADSQIFELKTLADVSRKEEILSGLRDLADGYENWIASVRRSISNRWLEESSDVRSRLSEAADRNLSACDAQLLRLRACLSDFSSDSLPHMWEAFCLANQAMRSSMLRGQGDANEPRWRPFQLAFLLISLRSTLDSKHEDRSILDLIWFPTGGGKTEAYLGLTCATIFYRRLSDPQASFYGTTVITRYTLRLLTLQQFERTARVIFACEVLRRGSGGKLGAEPISIGLYAGRDATPNKIVDAASLIASGAADDSSTTLPIDSCPWCSSKEEKTNLGLHNQSIVEERVLTFCPNTDCAFHDGMPFWCVDDEIYKNPPTFLIGTVDKFAQLTWEPRSSALLGGGASKSLPSSLIIQDELHLISDSLGSMTGLFETAIDLICEARGAKPKIVGSTATIKRAEDQCKQLFDREARQFPPSGVVHTDSFFYKEDRSIPGRLYAGVHAQGRSPKHTLPRVMALLKQFGASVESEEIRDKYHTLVCYFNSLRELGGALVLAEDDAPRYLESLFGADLLPNKVSQQSLNPVRELTSNLKVPEIRSLLKQLLVGLRSNDAHSEPIGLVLSTNMISVGVDVDRFGCMIINGQPKTTAEYIQASSRVGRPTGDAGLVVTVYNWTRPRDRSHYERFVGYHRAFYRHVEALTVTPFSSRARDKAVHSVLFAIARHLCPEVADQNAAGAINESTVAVLEQYINKIGDRAVSVSEEEVEIIKHDLHLILDEWVQVAQEHGGKNVVWSKYGANLREVVLLGDRDDDQGLNKTPLSMRDVDASSPVMLRWPIKPVSNR